MGTNKIRIKGDTVTCTIEPINNPSRNTWSITFPLSLYKFLNDHVGNVHHWADSQRDAIELGRFDTSLERLGLVRKGERPSQIAINRFIVGYGMRLLGESLDDL